MTDDRGRTKTAGHGVERNWTLHPRGTVTSGRPWVFDRLLLQTPASPVLQDGGWAGSRSSLLELSSANLYVQLPGVGTGCSEAPGHQRLRRSEGEEARGEPGPAGDDGGTCPHNAQVAGAPPDGRAVCLGSWTPGQECPRLQSPRPARRSGAQGLGVGEPAGEVLQGREGGR